MTKKPKSTPKLRIPTLAIAASLALSGLPLAAHAAGLGKVTVFSALGQPLRAEVELSASREELASMKASLASPEAFKSAGLDYASALLSIRFVLDKRASGQSIIKLTSDRPLNEPFIDMLLELNWASGRLVREYTFLLDPPEIASKAAAPVAVPEARVAAPKPAPASTKAAPPAAPRAAPATKPQPESTAGSKAEGGDAYQVKRGDTLRKIAAENQHEGVSLDQMLVGLFRANKDAFDGSNMNRLKAGKILTVPQKSEVEAVSTAEAQKVVIAQAADWNAYRRKLAASAAQAPASDEAGKQEASGKITAKVEDKAAPAAETKDQVRVSRTESGKGKPGATASEEDLLAKEKALKEANDRLVVLEKNVNELQKLLEMKNQNLAELQKQAVKPEVAAAKTPEPAVKPAEPPKPVESPKPVEAAKPVEPPKAVEPVKPVEAPKAVEPPVEPPKAEVAKPAEEKKPEPAKPVEAPKPKPAAVIPPPPPEEPSFFDELMDNPMLLAGGGGILALLAGYVMVKRRRTASSGELPLSTSTAGLSQTSLGENSVFRNTGGQSVDTSHTPPQTDFSQAGPGTIDTDEVDPVAEADVYMAYGRDAQAEEILLEAKTKDPKRYAIHLKLLEIYANRQSLKQFESLATELYSETSGVGADWEKAAAMGLKLDSQNPLYGGNRAAVAPEFDSDATVIVSAQTMKNTVTMPGQLAQMAAAAQPLEISSPELPMVAPSVPEPVSEEVGSLDFDLGPQGAEPLVDEVKSDLVTTVTLPETQLPPADAEGALDFDLGAASAKTASSADDTVVGLDFEMPEIKVDAPAVDDSGLDFDLGFDAPTPAEMSAPAVPTAPVAPVVSAVAAAPATADLVLDAGDVDTDALEFDVRLTESTVLGQPMSPSSFDMTSINLDLAEPKPAASALSDGGFEVAQMETVVNPALASSLESDAAFDAIGANEEVATKLDLAKAYEEMGDLEGARELLQEVLKEGNGEQQDAARAILERVGT
ncbi:MAG: FimV family protein [Betaproteobacteria bacterium]|uniref:FimV family protein n=1 Tax=Candidatus Proximibacter danicus TaxID=2954365 RepID=A0A9D7K3E1_9PROT|nr:FimV family protein [Candidatus Proximibacter danicus]